MSRPTLSSWSIQDIITMYKILGDMMHNLQRLHTFCIQIGMTDEQFDNHYLYEIKKTDSQLGALDKEIARRSNLVGVL